MISIIGSDNYKRIFAPDNRTFLDVRVFDTKLQDWQIVLDFLVSRYGYVYSEDGVVKPLPRADVIWNRQKKVTILLKVMLLPGFTVSCHFFDPQQIELDLLPEDVDSKDKASAVFDLMTGIGALLNREVFLLPEGSYHPERLEEVAICVADPKDGSVRSRLAGSGSKQLPDRNCR